MIPSRRTYALLGVGTAIAVLLFFVLGLNLSILALLIFDLVVLGLAFWDSRRVKPHRVSVHRQVASRLSIGRDNLVSLTVESGKLPAEIEIYDAFPLAFAVSSMPLSAKLSPNSKQEISYTVHPSDRGEYFWKSIQVRQLSPFI